MSYFITATIAAVIGVLSLAKTIRLMNQIWERLMRFEIKEGSRQELSKLESLNILAAIWLFAALISFILASGLAVVGVASFR